MDHDAIKAAMTEVIDEKMKDFWIERERHYKHHEFITEMICWTDKFKSATMKAVVNCIVVALLSAIAIGFIVWGRKV